MRHFLFITLAACMLACSSNKQTSQTTENDVKKSLELAESPICVEITRLRHLEDTLSLTQTRIIETEVKDKCACITYEFSGCNVGEPLIVWDETVTEENTWPTITMHVYSKNTGMCDQLHTVTTCFSLIELETLGSQVLVYLNGSKDNFLVNFQERTFNRD